MIKLRYYTTSQKMKFRYQRLTSWWRYLWIFTAITAVSLYLDILIYSWTEIYIRDWWKNFYHVLFHGFKGTYENYIQSLYVDSIWESAIYSAVGIIAIILFMLLMRFTLWLLDRLYSLTVNFWRYIKRYIFQGFFFL